MAGFKSCGFRCEYVSIGNNGHKSACASSQCWEIDGRALCNAHAGKVALEKMREQKTARKL